MITFVSRGKRQPADYMVRLLIKAEKKMQKHANNSPKASHCYSHVYLYSAYEEICCYKTHTSLKSKSQACTVKSVNSDSRHCMPPLRRKSEYFFHLIDTAKAAFKIFANAFGNFALHKFLSPI